MRNISKLFYKDYYIGVTFNYALMEEVDLSGVEQTIRSNNKKILEAAEQAIISSNKKILDAELQIIPANPVVNKVFEMRIAYPGLVTGTGLVHTSKKLKGAFNLGMHFDYTYGMPVIYGSSVKGVLLHYFVEFYEGSIKKELLVNDIFAGANKSIYDRDIFFDAVIVNSNNRNHILESDSITPHEHPLKNPTPITMLKIASGCTIEFRFKLVDSKIGEEIFKAEQKKELFQKIISTVGIGAKTNVGYGQFE